MSRSGGQDGAVTFRGRVLRATKHPDTASRLLPSAEALSRIEPDLARIGLTRLALITDQDRLGLPCAMAACPHRKGLSVTYGKGLSQNDARVSAAMEAIERYHGFYAPPQSFQAAHRELAHSRPVIPKEQLHVRRASLFHEQRPEAWVWGWDIVHQEEVALPLGYVCLTKQPGAEDIHSFQTSSNGLAAGLDLLEAILQGLLEVIERDAVACAMMAARVSGSVQPLGRVRLETVPWPPVRRIIERLERAGLAVLVYDCTSDLGIPVFQCRLLDKKSSAYPPAEGAGAGLDPAGALTRALTEAALARAGFHRLATDAVFRDEYAALRAQACSGESAECQQIRPSIDVSALEDLATPNFEQDINLCLERLDRVGLDRVLVLDLTLPGFVSRVVKVVVPGMEAVWAPDYRPGARGLAARRKQNELRHLFRA